MTRLLLVLLATVAAICADSSPDYEEVPRLADPLAIDPNAHPKDTLFNYLTSLTNYIYDTDSRIGADPRAAFFNQEHQLRIYETLNHYVEENYGLTLREILGDPNKGAVELYRNMIVGWITELADQVAEMFLTVIYTSGDKLANPERLLQVQKKRREVINTFATYASTNQLIDVYLRMSDIHNDVLRNFNETAYGRQYEKIRGKRDTPINEEEIQEELNGYLNKLTAYVYGSSATFLSQRFGKMLDIIIQPPGSLIAFKRFIQANYREVLALELPAIVDKDEKTDELLEIFSMESRTTALWFEVVNYANLDLLKNQTIIDDINSEIADRLYVYSHFRTFDEIKETNRRIHEVYGHLFKDCDTSSYRELSTIIEKTKIVHAELFRSLDDIVAPHPPKLVEKVLILAEAVWQKTHGMSENEKYRIRNLLDVLNETGVRVFIRALEGVFGVEGEVEETDFERHLFDNFERSINESNGFNNNFNETGGFQQSIFNDTGIEATGSVQRDVEASSVSSVSDDDFCF